MGNRILDRDSRPYLIRGTRLAALERDQDDEKGSVATAFGPLSRTTLATIRHRLNMNAVRLPVSPADYLANADYRSRTERAVRRANQLELLVILESAGAPADPALFWTRVAGDFANRPNVFFAALSADLIDTIRQAGAAQPVIVAWTGSVDNRNVIYQVTPRYLDLKTDQDRRRLFTSAAARVPVLVDGLDPDFGTASEECAGFPGDPTSASALIEANLAYFDAQRISWTASSFIPGKLITDFRYFNGTKLDPGWTCGQPPEAGLGMVLLAHLWNATPLGLLTVSESRGGLVVARGSVSTSYGPILADDDVQASEDPLPKRLGNVSIRITDARGVVRLAPLLHVLAGWGSISFVIPEECATGPAEVAVVRTDGSVSRSRVLIADLAPAIFTVPPDGRSVAFGHVTQDAYRKPAGPFPAWHCAEYKCEATPIAITPGVRTTMRLVGSGFRHAGEHPEVHAYLGDIEVPVIVTQETKQPGTDELMIQLPDALQDKGEVDLWFTVNGVLSNVSRINFRSGG